MHRNLDLPRHVEVISRGSAPNFSLDAVNRLYVYDDGDHRKLRCR